MFRWKRQTNCDPVTHQGTFPSHFERFSKLLYGCSPFPDSNAVEFIVAVAFNIPDGWQLKQKAAILSSSEEMTPLVWVVSIPCRSGVAPHAAGVGRAR